MIKYQMLCERGKVGFIFQKKIATPDFGSILKYPNMLHVRDIYLDLASIYGINVGKYPSPMEPMDHVETGPKTPGGDWMSFLSFLACVLLVLSVTV